MAAQRSLKPQPSEGVSLGSNPSGATHFNFISMRAIIYENGQVIVKRKRQRHYVLEYCKNKDVPTKIAYWEYILNPENRKKFEENIALLKYKFLNKKTHQELLGKYPDINMYNIKNKEDYELCDNV